MVRVGNVGRLYLLIIIGFILVSVCIAKKKAKKSGSSSSSRASSSAKSASPSAKSESPSAKSASTSASSRRSSDSSSRSSGECQCDTACKALPIVDNGWWALQQEENENNERFTDNATAVLHCCVGFTPVELDQVEDDGDIDIFPGERKKRFVTAGDAFTLECDENGHWIGERAQCQQDDTKVCDLLPDVQNGWWALVNPMLGFNEGATATLRCFVPHTSSGRKKRQIIVMTNSCVSEDGVLAWSNQDLDVCVRSNDGNGGNGNGGGRGRR